MADKSYELSPPAYDDDTSLNGATASPEPFSLTGQKKRVSTSSNIVYFQNLRSLTLDTA